MKALRTIGSILGILAAVVLAIGWATSSLIVSLVEDEDALTMLSKSIVESPQFQDTIHDAVQARADDALAEVGAGPTPEVNEAVTALVESDAFQAIVGTVAVGLLTAIVEQLVDPEREPGPLTLTIDVQELLEPAKQQLPEYAAQIALIDFPPQELELLDEDSFADVRGRYAPIRFVATWGGWAALALAGLAFASSVRKPWFLSKLLFVVGAVSLAGWAVVAFIGAATQEPWSGGSGEPDIAGVVIDFAGQRLESAGNTLLVVGLASLVAGTAALFGARWWVNRPPSPDAPAVNAAFAYESAPRS